MSTATASKFEVGSTYHVQPKTLLLERNIRDAKPDQDLIDSIAALGVLEPIGAVVTEDGALLVRSGHRRTMAAIAAKTQTVPVYVRGTDSPEDTDAEIVRIIEQRHENTRRAGLTTAEDVHSLGQLMAFGLTAGQIAEQAQVSNDQVAAAVRVTGSNAARAAAEEWDELSLDQVEAIAEFEEDAAAVKALVQAAQRGQFAHTVQRMRDDRDRDAAKAAVREQLVDLGFPVLDGRPRYNDKAKALDNLVDAESGRGISPAEHAECPGRVAWVDFEYTARHPDGTYLEDLTDDELAAKYGDEDGISAAFDEAGNIQRHIPGYGCTEPLKHGHRDRYGSSSSKPTSSSKTEKQREAEKAARRLVVENNKAWSSAQVVRREWLATFAGHKNVAKGTGQFITAALLVDYVLFDYDRSPTDMLADWLGAKPGARDGKGLAKHVNAASEARALHIGLMQVLAIYECRATKDAWRQNGETNAAGRYLRFLETCGYALSEVEKFAISKKTA